MCERTKAEKKALGIASQEEEKKSQRIFLLLPKQLRRKDFLRWKNSGYWFFPLRLFWALIVTEFSVVTYRERGTKDDV